MTPPPRYQHTQAGWPLRVTFAIAALLFILLSIQASPPNPRHVLWLGAGFCAVLGILFGSLTVRIDHDALHWWYGPGWPRWRIRLHDIVGVEVTRIPPINGWGIHWTRRGWLYNVAGLDAVLLRRRDGKTLLLGTDEPRKLDAALGVVLRA